jgi:hypothetical protein
MVSPFLALYRAYTYACAFRTHNNGILKSWGMSSRCANNGVCSGDDLCNSSPCVSPNHQGKVNTFTLLNWNVSRTRTLSSPSVAKPRRGWLDSTSSQSEIFGLPTLGKALGFTWGLLRVYLGFSGEYMLCHVRYFY